jgi:hypothetical protein
LVFIVSGLIKFDFFGNNHVPFIILNFLLALMEGKILLVFSLKTKRFGMTAGNSF